METRGMLVGVLVEYLSAVRARLEGRTTIIPQSAFARGLPDFTESLGVAARESFPQVTADQVQAMKAKARGLNYRPLRSQITSLANWLALDLPGDTVEAFVGARNSLAQRGQFPEGTAPIDSFLAMMYVLDQFVLRLFGYSGPYIHRQRQQIAHI